MSNVVLMVAYEDTLVSASIFWRDWSIFGREI